MTLNVKLNMDESGLGGGSGMRGMGSMMGRIGSSFDYRTKYQMGESGKVEVDKASVARQKSMLGSVEGLAKAIPGGGMMTNMAKSFMKGGPIGLIATGITAAASTLVAILKGSQTYQTLSKTWMTILSAMADMFLMPFVPLAMKGFQTLLDWMPKVAEWGKKAADVLSSIFSWFQQRAERREKMQAARQEAQKIVAAGPGASIQKYKDEGDSAVKAVTKGLLEQEGARAMANPYVFGGAARAFGGVGTGSMTLVSGEEVAQSGRNAVSSMTDPAATASKKVKSFATREKQVEKSFWQKWYDMMFGNSIVTDTFAVIKGMYGNVASEAANTGKEVGGEAGKNQKKGMFSSLVTCLKGLGASIGTFVAGLSVPQIPLPKFSPPSIDTIKDCLKKGAAAVGGFFTETLPGWGKTIVGGVVEGAKKIGGAVLGSKPVQFIIACGKKAWNAFQGWWGGVKDWWNKSGDELEKQANAQSGAGGFGNANGYSPENAVSTLLKSAGRKIVGGFQKFFKPLWPFSGQMAVTGGGGGGEACAIQPPVNVAEEFVGQQEAFSKSKAAERLPKPYNPRDRVNTAIVEEITKMVNDTAITVRTHAALDKGLYGQDRGYFANIGAAYGDKFGNLGMIGGGASTGPISVRPTEINIYSDWSPSDIVADIDRMAVMEDASYFNGVM